MLTDTALSERQPNLATKLVNGYLTALHTFLAICPILPILFMYLASWRMQTLVGHWPTYLTLADDPWKMGSKDPLMDFLNSTANFAILLALMSILLFPAVTWGRRHDYPVWRISALVIIYVLFWLLSKYDPTNRWLWFWND